MRNPSFIGYVEGADYHDAVVLGIEKIGDVVRVRVRSYDGKVSVSEFSGVQTVRAKRPDGMLLYALSEMCGEPPLRSFVFTNWHEDDDASLEIDAERVRVYEEPSTVA